MRLNSSNAKPELMREGKKRLGLAVRKPVANDVCLGGGENSFVLERGNGFRHFT